MNELIAFVNAHAQELLYSLPLGLLIFGVGIFISQKNRFLAMPFKGVGLIWILWAFVGFYQI